MRDASPLALLTRLSLALLFASLLAAACRAQGAPVVAEARAGGDTTTGSITGRVVGEGGEPLPFASVFAAPKGSGASSRPASVTTDANGSFEIRGLQRGIYAIGAMAPGYVLDSETSSAANHHRVGDNVTIRMLKGGVITGTVTDASGEPVVAVGVRAVRVRDAEGRALPTGSLSGAVREFRTDDRGVYRIFGLPPGAYVVYAGGETTFYGFLPSAYAGDVPTFYPSGTRDTAAEVSVRAGQEAIGIDIRYRDERGRRVTGTITFTQGAPATNASASVTLTHAGTGMMMASTWADGRREEERSFTFNGVADGDYEVHARFTSQDGLLDAVSAPLPVKVRGADVTGLRLALVPFASMSGSLIVEQPAQGAAEACGTPPVHVRPQEVVIVVQRDERQMRTRRRHEVAPDEGGSFRLRNLEQGRYRIEARPLEESFYVSALRLPAAAPAARTAPAARAQQPAAPAASAEWIDLKAGQQLSGLSVRISPGAAYLSGRIAPPEGEAAQSVPPASLRVYLLPAERERVEELYRYQETAPTPEGSFVFKNIAPGRYLLVTRPADSLEAQPRSPLWDASERAKLRREAEALNAAVEFLPCRRVADFVLRAK